MMEVIFLGIAAYFGLFCHWLKKWGREQIDKGFFEYMSDNRRHSVGSVAGTAGAIAALVVASPEITMTNIVMAFLCGFSIDSTVNK